MIILKENFHKISKILTDNNITLDSSSDLSYYLKFGFPDVEQIDIELVKKTPLVKKPKTIFKQGKYKNQELDTIKIKDPQYIKWMQSLEDYEKNFLEIKAAQLTDLKELTSTQENILSFELNTFIPPVRKTVESFKLK